MTMHWQRKLQWTEFILFLLILYLALAPSFLPARLFPQVLFSFLVIPPSIWLFRNQKRTFTPALFFAIQALVFPWLNWALDGKDLILPQLQFLPAICIYLLIVISRPGLRREIHWLRVGGFNRITYALIILIVVFSGLALAIWAQFIAEDLDKFQRYVPLWPLWLLGLYGLIFPIVNSLLEEFLARAALYDGFQSIWGSTVATIGLQAMVFALWHFQGFPGGLIGVIMVFVWSIFLGILRHQSRGMAAPLVAHFFADLTIAILQFFIFILPTRHWL